MQAEMRFLAMFDLSASPHQNLTDLTYTTLVDTIYAGNSIKEQ